MCFLPGANFKSSTLSIKHHWGGKEENKLLKNKAIKSLLGYWGTTGDNLLSALELGLTGLSTEQEQSYHIGRVLRRVVFS